MGRTAKKIAIGRRGSSKRTTVVRKKKRTRNVTSSIVKAEMLPPAQVVRHGRTQNLRPEEIELLRRTVAKGTSDDEFSLFMLICRKHKVDPFIGQIHCAKWWIKKHHKEKRPTQDGKGEIEVWVGGEQMVIMMGINGYRSIAARHHKDYGGSDEPTFTFFEDKRKTPAGKLIPETASIKLWKKGLEHPIVATVYWEEFAPFDLGSERGDFWNRMPKHKLGIVSESHALRKGYPDLANIYVDEEMDQKLQDFSPEGRLVVESDGRTPSGAPATKDVQSWRGAQEAIDAEVERQKKGETPSTVDQMQGKVAQTQETVAHTTTTTPKAGAPVPAGGGPVDASSPAGPVGKIEIDWADKNSPIVRGDLADAVLHSIQKHCKATRKDDWWHVLPADVQTIREMCAAYNYQFLEVFPGTQKGNAVPPPKKKASAEPVVSETVKGTLERVTSGMTQNNAPTRQVKIAGAWYTSYKNTIFEFLDKGLGKDAELWLDKRKNIIGCKRIGQRQFLEDGKTPIVDRSEPRGGNLFEK